MSTICVYGAASARIDDQYIILTEELGAEMGRRGFAMIFGGGATGLMGAAARGMTSVGGRIIGVTPRFMHSVEPLYENCTEIIDTKSMAKRKEVMESKADAFIITPGGIGTFDEFFQILTLKELGQLGPKPIILFNVLGYFNELIDLILASDKKGFLRPTVTDLFTVCETPKDVLDAIEEQLAELMSSVNTEE